MDNKQLISEITESFFLKIEFDFGFASNVESGLNNDKFIVKQLGNNIYYGAKIGSINLLFITTCINTETELSYVVIGYNNEHFILTFKEFFILANKEPVAISFSNKTQLVGILDLIVSDGYAMSNLEDSEKIINVFEETLKKESFKER